MYIEDCIYTILQSKIIYINIISIYIDISICIFSIYIYTILQSNLYKVTPTNKWIWEGYKLQSQCKKIHIFVY